MFYSHKFIYVLYLDIRKTGIISLYSIKGLFFITECVYCAVRAKYLNIIQVDFVFIGFSTQLYLLWKHKQSYNYIIQLRHY
jgi:hypothetical protein